jgi:hypothetical protein
MDEAERIGEVLPVYGTLRRAVLPIYGVDQLIFLVLMAVPFILLASVNSKLALHTGVGAYIGFVVTMQRSTPSSVLLPATDEQRLAVILDRSPFFERADDGAWNSTKGRLHRWDTDNIRLRRNGQTIRLIGRKIDLQKIVALLGP